MRQDERAGDMCGKVQQRRIVHIPNRQDDDRRKNHKKNDRNYSIISFLGRAVLDCLIVEHGFIARRTSYDALRKIRAAIHHSQGISEFLL
jgi:hypothetical protein